MRDHLVLGILAFLLSTALPAQEQPEQESRHGWHLSPHGTIRVLVIFAEVEYDKNPAWDIRPNGADHWPVGQLPTWKDAVFDPHPLPTPKAEITRYYHDISLGRYTVLGDYLSEVVTLRESTHGDIRNMGVMSRAALIEANKMGAFRTAHGLGVEDFDLWKDGGKPGMPKEVGADDPHSFDHVMVILRNSSLDHGQGSTDAGSSGELFGFRSDTQSRFGASNGLPFEILKHEFNHLLLGGNNFHSAGGNAAQFTSYFIPVQGGHSMMGAASSALLTCCAWDRDRLGWTAKDGCGRINARDMHGTCISGDLEPLNGDTGFFVLRDFVTTGDAIRIRMPFLGDDEYPQFLWLENHLGWKKNGSPSDRFHYELEMSCVVGVQPGIFAVMQIDRDDRTGKNIFGGHADYLRPLPASGLFDLEPRGDTVRFECLWPGNTVPLVARDRNANPLTGVHELEIPVFDLNTDGILDRSKEGLIPRVIEDNGKYLDDALFFGHARQAFTKEGNERMGLGTNPPLANMITATSSPRRMMYKQNGPDVRVIHLTGMSVQLVEQRDDGSVLLHISSNQTLVDNDVRWCGDSIVLHANVARNGNALCLAEGRTITIDRSRSPTRVDDAEKIGAMTYFSAPTSFTIESGAHVCLEHRSKLSLEHGSTLHVMPGAVLELRGKAKLSIDGTSQLVVHGDGKILASKRQKKVLARPGRYSVTE